MWTQERKQWPKFDMQLKWTFPFFHPLFLFVPFFFFSFIPFLMHHTNTSHSACSVNRLLLCCFSGIRLIKRDIVFAASLYLWIWKTSGAVAISGKPHTNCDLCIQKTKIPNQLSWSSVPDEEYTVCHMGLLPSLKTKMEFNLFKATRTHKSGALGWLQWCKQMGAFFSWVQCQCVIE